MPFCFIRGKCYSLMGLEITISKIKFITKLGNFQPPFVQKNPTRFPKCCKFSNCYSPSINVTSLQKHTPYLFLNMYIGNYNSVLKMEPLSSTSNFSTLQAWLIHKLPFPFVSIKAFNGLVKN
jgi:hypothetical protein